MVTSDFETIVIGAGAIGLACAYQLSLAGRQVMVLEEQNSVGQGISSRNSEVIHAGIYYPKGSRKAELCVEGRQALYAFCKEFGVDSRQCGKIIVATDSEHTRSLAEVISRASANGVNDLRRLSRADLRAMEPELEGIQGVFSPSTGIIDSHSYMLALQGAIEAHGGMVAFNCPVLSAVERNGIITLQTGGRDPTTISAQHVVIAAGLSASKLARNFDNLAASAVPETFFARGNYFSLSRRSPFSRLIYPVPEPGGLGVHLTIDLAGSARFGPDVEWLEEADPSKLGFEVDPSRAQGFYAAIRRYWPDLKDGELVPAYSGIRPKLSRPGGLDADFQIQGPPHHGASNVIALYGIESPGLTSSLAIGKLVERTVTQMCT